MIAGGGPLGVPAFWVGVSPAGRRGPKALGLAGEGTETLRGNGKKHQRTHRPQGV